MIRSFTERLTQRNLLVGSIVSLSSPEVAEILAHSGLDWLFVDLEHSALGVMEAQALVQAAGPQMPCVLRVPAVDDVWIKKCLDTGAAGIIVPQIRTAAEAQRAVSLCKYPPAGIRGAGPARAQGYGYSFADYVARANHEIAVIIQVEHIDAVENIDAIKMVPGIDALLVGPYDLSGSMGKLGQVLDPEVQDAIARVTKSVKPAGIPLGIFGTSPEAVKPFIAEGFTLIAVGTDAMLLGGAARQMVQSLHP
jgi:2-keto-3-deoxy-L-rhamnonate aldolase RhmA